MKAKGPQMTIFIVKNGQPSTGIGVQPIIFIENDAVSLITHLRCLRNKGHCSPKWPQKDVSGQEKFNQHIFGATFDKMEVDHELTPTNSPLYGFIGNRIIPRKKITLGMEIGTTPLIVHHFMEFFGSG